MTEHTLDFKTLMYFCGDVKSPLLNSVDMMAQVVRDQMNLLLLKLEEIVCKHRATIISHGDVLFILKKNKAKLKRLLHHLQATDLKSGEHGGSDLFIEPKKKRKYFKMCLDYLVSIEDCGELSSLLQNNKILEISVKKRKMRQQWRANMMSFSEQEEYAKICKEISGPFPQFKKWLLQDKVTDLDLTDCALSIVEFLTRETVAEIIDMILLLKMNKLQKCQYLLRDYCAHLAQPEPKFKIDTASKAVKGDIPSILDINQMPKRSRTYKHVVETDCGPMRIHVRVEEIKTKSPLPTGVANDAVSDVSEDTERSSVSDMDFNTNNPTNDSQGPKPIYEPISDASDQENTNDKTGNSMKEPKPVYEPISDASDQENSDKTDNSIKEPPERRIPSPSVNSDVYTCYFPAEYYEFDSSTASNHLSISAKNEVEFLSPVEPSEISDAFARFQEPSRREKMFNICVVPRRTNLICLLDSLSVDYL